MTQSRRYQYKNQTRFAEFFKPKKWLIVREWLRPYLKAGENLDELDFLEFDFSSIPKYMSPMKALGEALKIIVDRKNIRKRYTKNMILRYLSDSKHSNLNVSEIKLKSYI